MTPIRCTILLCACVMLAGCSKEHTLTTSSQEALSAYREGVVQWQKFYYTEARQSFEQALRHDSTFAMAWMRIAVIDQASHNEPGALHSIAQAMHFSAGISAREKLLIRMWDRRLRFDAPGAAVLADSILRLYPDEKEVYVFRGNIYEENKDFDAAIRLYQKAIDVDTSFAMAVMTLGYAYSTIGEQERALALMQRYIRLAPDAADPRASYADLLVRVGRYQEALEQYRKSLTLKPDYWYSIRMIGEIDAVMGRLREAGEQFHQSLKLLPQNRQLEGTDLHSRGVLGLMRGDNGGAEELFRKALAIDTSDPSPALGLTIALSRQKKFKEAEEILEVLRREIGKRNMSGTQIMTPYHVAWSRLLMDEGRLDDALAACDSALGYSSRLTRSAVYRQMAEVLLRQKAYEQALDACSEALTVNPNYPDALLTLTRIYHERRDAAMTREIGARLLDFWKDADPDFVAAKEVRRLLGTGAPRT